MAELKIPTEEVSLPSKGLLYSKESPLSSGKIEMKYMTAREEDILTNTNFIKNGTVIDKLLQSLIVTPINYDDLLIGDKNAILIAARILAYGSAYSFEYFDSETDTKETINIDLNDLKNKEVDYSLYSNKNEFTFVLPNSKNTVTFKLLTVGDEKAIEAEAKGLKKANIAVGEVTSRLKHQILSVNGNYEAKDVRDFVDNYLIAKDSNPLRSYITSISPDIDLTINFTLSSGKEITQSLPLTAEFFFSRDLSIEQSIKERFLNLLTMVAEAFHGLKLWKCLFVKEDLTLSSLMNT
jgi:hypothetical protein